MDVLCPGFEQAFRSQWLPSLLRHEEGAYLLEWASAGSTWLGCTRETAESATGGEATEDSGGEAGVAVAGEVDGKADGAAARPLWMLAGKNGIWFLEALTLQDRATYCFSGGDEVPGLVSRLLCVPQFSKEALYSPLDALVGDSTNAGIAARSLGFLVELRKRFRQRVIHRGADGWKKDIEKLGGA
jgi:hypothetical protein